MKRLAWRLRFTRIMMQLTDCGFRNAWRFSGECAEMFGYEFWRDVEPALAARFESAIYEHNKREN